MNRPLILKLLRKYSFRYGLMALTFLQLLAFQNCTRTIEFSSLPPSSNAPQLTLGENGSGYEGKLYVHQNRCDGAALSLESAIKDYGNQGGVWLVRENCKDLASWRRLQETDLVRFSHDDSVLGYNRQAYDLLPSNSTRTKTTAAFCVGPNSNPLIEAQVWLPAGQSTLLANVFENSVDGTGALSLMPPVMPTSASTLYRSQPQYLIAVEAYGEPALNIWPLMGWSIDTTDLGQISVNTPTASIYNITTRQKPGIHDFQISFLNDYYTQKPEDRNLILRSITVKATDGSGATSVLDLTKMVPVPPFLPDSYYMLNGDLRVLSEVALKQPVQFPEVAPDFSFTLLATQGLQSSQLQYKSSSALLPVSVPVTCYLQLIE